MRIVEHYSCIAPDVMAELQLAAERLARGQRDAADAKQAALRMDRMREENRQFFGEQHIGVNIVRQMRDGR